MNIEVSTVPAVVQVLESDDGIIRGTIYTDFLGIEYYTIAARRITLDGFRGDDMVARKSWHLLARGYGACDDGAMVRDEIESVHESQARRYEQTLAKVVANKVPWVTS